MDDLSKEERIRARAYELWENSGRQPGHDDEYWDKARISIENEAPAVLGEKPLPNKAEKGSKT